MEKPRICYVNPPVLLKRPVSEIIDRLNKKGYKISLLIPKKLFRKRDASLHYSRLVDNSRIYTYSTINPPFINAEQPLPITPLFCINTFKALKNNDIIHMWVPYYLTSLKIILTKRIFFPKKKLILTMDTVPGYSFSMGKFWDRMFRIYNKMFGWLLFGTPSIITLYGKSLVPYAIKAGIPEQKIRVIPTGIDTSKDIFKHEQSSAKKNRTELIKEIKELNRTGLSINPNTVIVLFAGLLIPRKGADKVIRIADKLRNKDVVFLLAGDGPGRKKYEKMVRELKLEHKVFLLGWRTDIHKLYQASNVFLLPAEGEGLPGVVMEAMAYGVPCVASNIPCIPDLIDNGKNGFLCNKDDIDEFSSRITELAGDKRKRVSFSKQAIIKIKKFEWKNVLNEYERLYEQVYIG
jgi:glycosyltransferase involved in cell wall biosynthesis